MSINIALIAIVALALILLVYAWVGLWVAVAYTFTLCVYALKGVSSSMMWVVQKMRH
jgi:hypothetical protein